jgi:hypothetical protein
MQAGCKANSAAMQAPGTPHATPLLFGAKNPTTSQTYAEMLPNLMGGYTPRQMSMVLRPLRNPVNEPMNGRRARNLLSWFFVSVDGEA